MFCGLRPACCILCLKPVEKGKNTADGKIGMADTMAFSMLSMPDTWLLAYNMELKQIFIANLKSFRKREGISQMKLAERCDTSPGYIGEIEIGRKFPSIEMIDKMAAALKIEPHHFFINRSGGNESGRPENYPRLPKPMTDEITSQIYTAVGAILSRY
jgi:transcriptional regulator with XRE-family HTH domain